MRALVASPTAFLNSARLLVQVTWRFKLLCLLPLFYLQEKEQFLSISRISQLPASTNPRSYTCPVSIIGDLCTKIALVMDTKIIADIYRAYAKFTKFSCGIFIRSRMRDVTCRDNSSWRCGPCRVSPLPSWLPHSRPCHGHPQKVVTLGKDIS